MYDTSFYIVNIFEHFEIVILDVVVFISNRHFALRYEVFFSVFRLYHTKPFTKPVSGYLFQHGVEMATVGQFRSTAGYVAQKLPSKLEMRCQVLVGEDRTSDPLMTFDG